MQGPGPPAGKRRAARQRLPHQASHVHHPAGHGLPAGGDGHSAGRAVRQPCCSAGFCNARTLQLVSTHHHGRTWLAILRSVMQACSACSHVYQSTLCSHPSAQLNPKRVPMPSPPDPHQCQRALTTLKV